MDKVRRLKRAARVRHSLKSTAARPRLSVFRSNAHIWAQLINDAQGVTLAAASDHALKEGTKSAKAALVGAEIARLALKLKLKQAVFDRGSYRFHGRVKALAEGARQAGLTL